MKSRVHSLMQTSFWTLSSQVMILLHCQLSKKKKNWPGRSCLIFRINVFLSYNPFLSCLVQKLVMVRKCWWMKCGFLCFFSPLVMCRPGRTSIFSSKTWHVLCFLGTHTSFFNEDCLLLLYETLTTRSFLLVTSINALLKLAYSLVLPSSLFATGGCE